MLRILSYNISWEAATGKWARCRADGNPCIDNIIAFINNHGPYDFVGLQEASNYHLVAGNSVLAGMARHHYKPGREDIVLFWDPKKYQLDAGLVEGWLEDEGRPFVMAFFRQQICVIVLHAGHKQNSPADITRFIKRTIKQNYAGRKKEIASKLRAYHIIMMGDFNSPLAGGTVFFADQFFGMPGGVVLEGRNKVPTCCDSSAGSRAFRAFDHVLSTYGGEHIRSEVYRVPNASDHLPIISVITGENIPREEEQPGGAGADEDGMARIATGIARFMRKSGRKFSDRAIYHLLGALDREIDGGNIRDPEHIWKIQFEILNRMSRDAGLPLI